MKFPKYLLAAAILLLLAVHANVAGQEPKTVAQGQKEPGRDVSEFQESLTVLNYNVWNGFQGGKSYDRAVDWVKTVDPDIAGWQELVRWNEKRLQAAAGDWNHPFAATLKQGGYNIGLTSKTPIEVVERKTAGFHHGYLHCRTAGIDVIVCHLWPGTRRGQLREATMLRDLVVGLHQESRQVLLMGDFNAHSQADASWLNQQAPLIERRLPGDEKKSPEDRFIQNGKYTSDVMNRIFEAPLQDVVIEKFLSKYAEPSQSELLQLGSFPTRVLDHVKTRETQQGFLERIDFILATPGLAAHCNAARICRDEVVLDSISDHYPVIATFGRN